MAKQISEAAHSAKNKIKMTPGDRVLNLFFYLFITLFAVICLIPSSWWSPPHLHRSRR